MFPLFHSQAPLPIPGTCAKYIQGESSGYYSSPSNDFKVWLNNVEYTLPTAVSRGWNFVIIDPTTLTVKENKVYDLYEAPGWACWVYGKNTINDNMVAYLDTISASDIVVYGVYDDAFKCTYDSGYNKMIQNLGYPSSYSYQKRASLVLIGEMGMPGNTAVYDKNHIEEAGQTPSRIGKCVVECGEVCTECLETPENCTICAPHVSREPGSPAPECYCAVGFYKPSLNTQLACETCDASCNPNGCIDSSTCCSYKCSHCIDNDVNNCRFCSDVNRSNPPTCGCVDNYYDDGSSVACQPCVHPCINCQSDTVCDTCKTGLKRNTAPPCGCQDGYYDDGANGDCVKCPLRCETCSDGNTCLTCKTGTGRSEIIDVSQNCGCLPTFFEETGTDKLECDPCQYPCKNCSGSATTCDTCWDDNNRKADCTCQDKFFNNESLKQCDPCSHKCGKCETNSDNCTECSDTNREYLDNCNCKPTFFEANTEICGTCSKKCATCTGTADSCDTCFDSLRENRPNCTCIQGYYNIPGQGECGKCSYKCLKCETTPDNCTSCSHATRPSTPNCECQSNTIDVLDQAQCRDCSIKCTACQIGSLINCQACDSDTRTNAIDPTCPCKPTYYDEGQQIQHCLSCEHPCVNCTSLTVCTSCISGFKRLSHPTCGCELGYYDDGSTADCQQCQHPCVNCTSATECTSCVVRTNANSFPDCTCIDGFYEDSDKNCVRCPLRCKKCNNENECTECETTGTGRSLAVPPFCACEEGKFEFNNELNCQDCDFQCKSCSGSSNTCSECSDDTRELSLNCICKPNYFQQGSEITCQNCSPICLSCKNNADQCETCSDQFKIPPLCNTCISGFFLNPTNNNTCEKCDEGCSSCEQEPSKCTKCLIGLNRSMVAPDCGCQDGYFPILNSNDCQKCNYKCQKCDNQNTCLQCLNPTLQPPLCISSRLSTYTVDITLPDNTTVQQESQCLPKCASCNENAYKCNSCVQSENRNLSDIPNCSCLPGFHDNFGTLIDCVKCSTNCELCESFGKCQKCEQSTGMELDQFNQECICPSGQQFSEESKKCEKCLFYKNICQKECPKNTKLDKLTSQCIEIEKEYISKMQLIIIVSSILLTLATIIVLSQMKTGINKSIKRIADLFPESRQLENEDPEQQQQEQNQGKNENDVEDLENNNDNIPPQHYQSNMQTQSHNMLDNSHLNLINSQNKNNNILIQNSKSLDNDIDNILNESKEVSRVEERNINQPQNINIDNNNNQLMEGQNDNELQCVEVFE